MRHRKAKPGPTRIDRWGTLNLFVAERLAGLTEESGSASTGLLWLVLFALANGRDGTIRGASVSRLARLTGLDRVTVRAALKRLTAAGALRVHAPGAVPVYVLEHCTKADDE